MKNTKVGFRECSRCHYGIGNEVYKSDYLEGEYCTSDCYTSAMMEKLGIKEELESEIL